MYVLRKLATKMGSLSSPVLRIHCFLAVLNEWFGGRMLSLAAPGFALNWNTLISSEFAGKAGLGKAGLVTSVPFCSLSSTAIPDVE